MRLDTRIRDLPAIDPAALGLDVMSMTSGECMQLFCVGGMKELILLYLHRRFLFEAVSDEQCADISTHKYAYSVNACLKAAIAMVRQTRGAPFVSSYLWIGAEYFVILPQACFGKIRKCHLDFSSFGCTDFQVSLLAKSARCVDI
jgi:hypothetical protein